MILFSSAEVVYDGSVIVNVSNVTNKTELENALKDQISGKVEKRAKQIVSQYAFDCAEDHGEAIKNTCALCQVS